MSLNIMVYGKPDCMQCKRTTNALTRKNTPYTYVDVTTDAEALKTVQALGYRQMPVVTADLPDGQDHWSGLSEKKLEALIYLATTSA